VVPYNNAWMLGAIGPLKTQTKMFHNPRPRDRAPLNMRESFRPAAQINLGVAELGVIDLEARFITKATGAPGNTFCLVGTPSK
jgi:hypothetical protein